MERQLVAQLAVLDRPPVPAIRVADHICSLVRSLLVLVQPRQAERVRVSQLDAVVPQVDFPLRRSRTCSHRIAILKRFEMDSEVSFMAALCRLFAVFGL